MGFRGPRVYCKDLTEFSSCIVKDLIEIAFALSAHRFKSSLTGMSFASIGVVIKNVTCLKILIICPFAGVES